MGFKTIKQLEKGCGLKKFNRFLSSLQGEKVYDICGSTRIDKGVYLCEDCQKLLSQTKAIKKMIEDKIKLMNYGKVPDEFNLKELPMDTQLQISMLLWVLSKIEGEELRNLKEVGKK